ncbi:hypothetical protein D3C78_1614890 [compost metagenome]
MGNYSYYNTINNDPIVDIYQEGTKRIYILVVPDEVNRVEKYTLDLGTAKHALVYHLNPGSSEMKVSEVNTDDGLLEMEVTETPVFVQAK